MPPVRVSMYDEMSSFPDITGGFREACDFQEDTEIFVLLLPMPFFQHITRRIANWLRHACCIRELSSLINSSCRRICKKETFNPNV